MSQKRFLMVAGAVLAVVTVVGTLIVLRDESDEPALPTQQTGNRWSVPVTVTEYKFDTGILSALPPGQAAFQVSVTGKAPHEFQVFRLADGVDLIRFQQAAMRLGRDSKLFELGIPVGGVGAGGGIQPGSSGRVVLDLELGRYAFVSFINGDHRQGMISPFDVLEGEEAPAGDPVIEGSIAMTDDGFELPASELAPGMYGVSNRGEAVHEGAIFELEGSVDELLDQLDEGRLAAGAAGFSLLGAGRSAYSELNLPAGRYAFVCRATDPETDRPFFTQGMVQEFEIP